MSASRTLLFFSLLMCYIITLTSNLIGTETDWFLSFLLPIFDCWLLSLLVGLLNKIKLGIVVSIPVVAILFSELLTVFFYHSNFTIYVILLLFETNVQESTEFIQAALAHPGTWYAVVITILAGIAAYYLARLSRKPFKYKKSLAFVAFALVAWSGIRQVSAYYKLYRCFSSASTVVCNDTRFIPHLNTPFVRLAYGAAFNMATSAELDILEKTVAATTVDSCSYRCPLIVLVIGESFNKHHTPLYEKDYLPTTPLLMQQQEKGNLVVYTDAVAPFNFTSNAFKYMLSTWDEESGDEWTRHTLFPAVFKKAGFCVDFYTNQFAMAQTDMWDFAGGTVFNHHGLSELQFTHRNPDIFDYDGELLRELPPTDSLTAQPTLLIVHLRGQHVKYDNRYPQTYAKFTPNDEKTPFGGETGREIAAHYDNATLYNDAVVNTVFKMLKNTDGIGIFLSDHGEEVYDWRDKYERTNERTITPEVARYQYEIPLMFYMTDTFKVRHPDVAEAVTTSADRPFISSDLCHLLFYLGGISIADYQEKRNILSPQYDKTRKRIIGSSTDYDELMRDFRH
jgi:heptose-I-phosphate ethanolaminephosphotransferase